MKLLAFSDLHTDLDRAKELVEAAGEADVVVAAGDFASQHRGLEPTIGALAMIAKPTVLVPGNNETEEALRAACSGWPTATVLHGAGTEIDGIEFFGLGAGVPVTPWDWSFDLTEEVAAQMLAGCPEGAVLVLHSPPYGHCDTGSGGESLGSRAILQTIQEKHPRLAVCGHIHDAWGEQSSVAGTPVSNLGPGGRVLEVAS